MNGTAEVSPSKVTFELGLVRMKGAFPCGEGRVEIFRQRKFKYKVGNSVTLKESLVETIYKIKGSIGTFQDLNLFLVLSIP